MFVRSEISVICVSLASVCMHHINGIVMPQMCFEMSTDLVFALKRLNSV